MTVYVAPASRPLTVLHIADEDAANGTACGMIMRDDEHWLATERRPGERVCLVCATATAEPVEAAEGARQMTLGDW